MPCASFEDLLLEYRELSADERKAVDAHLAGCANCRQYLETAAELDAALAETYSGAQTAPAFREAVLSGIRAETHLPKPSALPEVLDFIGWAGVIAAMVCLTPLLPPFRPEFRTIAVVSAAIAVVAAIWAGMRLYADPD